MPGLTHSREFKLEIVNQVKSGQKTTAQRSREDSPAPSMNQGLDPKALADRLGHAHASTALDVYGHVFEEQRERAALSLHDLLKDRGEAQPATLPN